MNEKEERIIVCNEMRLEFFYDPYKYSSKYWALHNAYVIS